MQLLIVRHAIAVDHGTAGIAEDDRPLTEAGAKKFRQAAQGLARILERPDVLLTSPLPRAHQTAAIAAEVWGGMGVTVAPPLAGGSFAEIATLVSAFHDRSCVALFGHEPDVSELLTRLLGARHADRLAFKKGGAALVDTTGSLADGGNLVWFLPPKILRELAD